MATGLLEIQGTLDLAHYWPKGDSDADTSHSSRGLWITPFLSRVVRVDRLLNTLKKTGPLLQYDVPRGSIRRQRLSYVQSRSRKLPFLVSRSPSCCAETDKQRPVDW
jgi:hypothetical protein